MVEALSNIPPEARGRLQTMLVLAEEVVVQAAHGYQIVIDTGFGTAAWHVASDTEMEEEDAVEPAAPQPDVGPQVLPGQAWADATDPPATGLGASQPEPVAPQPALTV